MANNNEIERRRTFAIIAHPDAGKTSLTEKLLLFGGQIQVAGAVKSNKIKKTATSDWMDIEKQRGISVTTSVMEFDYKEYKINILDTPGHQDFAEDTYRTLTAVDSVIIVVDGAKGVETQTRKLMEVCRMRNTPVIIFINKMDREAKDPFDLLDELEEELAIHVRPLTWPIESGVRFKGVYNIYENNLNLFQPSKQVVTEKVEVDINTEELDKQIGAQLADKLRGELELIDGVYPEFDKEEYLKGELAPVFFGSALNNFGVQELLDCFVEIAPSPRPVQAEEREVEPEEPKFKMCIRDSCDADRVIGYPDAFVIYIEVVNTVAVHGIIAIVIRHDVGGALIGIHIHFIYTGTICSYQYFFVIEGFDTCNADILQTDIQLYSLMNIHIVQINAFLERTDE